MVKLEIKKEKIGMKKTIVWGCGRKLQKIIETFPVLIEYVDIFIDNCVECFCGKAVCKPNVLHVNQDSQIVICVYSSKERKEIQERIMTEFGIDERCIISENAWLIEELSEHEDILLRPTSVRLEGSTLCQLNCTSCAMRLREYGKLGKGYLKFKDFKEFIENNNFVRNIELSNYGEVFLNPDLKEIIHYAGVEGIQITMNNGVNFNYVRDEVIEEMVRSGAVTSMTVSIDGASQEIYEKYRRNGSFQHVIENIRKLNAVKKKYHSKYPNIRWQYILFEHNECDVEQAKQVAEDLNIDIFFKLDWGNHEWIPKDREKLEAITKMKYFSRPEYEAGTGRPYIMHSICAGMIFQPQINYDGRLLGCCAVNLSDWGQNVFQSGIITAVNDRRYRDAILMLLGKGGMVVDDDSPCAKCRWLSLPKAHILL